MAGGETQRAPVNYFELLSGLCARYQGYEQIKILAGPGGPEWCSPTLLGDVAEAARELDIGVHIHVLESPMQRELSGKHGGNNTIAGVEQLGLLGPRTSIAHAAWFNDDDMRRCVNNDTSVVHNPSSNLKLRNGIAPVARMLELGVNVALGCDSTALNCDDDLLQEARLANYRHRSAAPSALSPCPSARDVLKMATVNAGAPTNFGNDIGTLEVGSYADAVLVDYEALSAPNLDPDLDPAEVLITLANHRHVDTVMVGGEVAVQNGQHVSLNEDEICAQLAESICDQPARREVAKHFRKHLHNYYAREYSGISQSPYYSVNSAIG
jgi:5-methylthioadenosine/S-adenosylhomocysteine deaminase